MTSGRARRSARESAADSKEEISGALTSRRYNLRAGARGATRPTTPAITCLDSRGAPERAEAEAGSAPRSLAKR